MSLGADATALVEDLGALVDHRVEQALQDLLVGDLAPGDAQLGVATSAMIFSTTRVGDRRAVALLVVVEAVAGLLAAAAQLAERIGDRCFAPRALRMRQPTSRPARSPIANGPIGKPKSVQHLVDLVRQRALQEQLLRLAAALARACGCRRSRGRRRPAPAPCRCVLPSAIAVAITSASTVFVAAHDLQQPHDVGRAEEVQCRSRSPAAWWPTAISSMSSVEVLVARIAPGLAMASSLAKTSFLTSISSNTASMTMSASASAVEVSACR